MRRWKMALPALALVPALCLPACTAARRAQTANAVTELPPPASALAETSETQPWWETALDEDFAPPETTLVPRITTETETLTETTQALTETATAVQTSKKKAEDTTTTTKRVPATADTTAGATALSASTSAAQSTAVTQAQTTIPSTAKTTAAQTTTTTTRPPKETTTKSPAAAGTKKTVESTTAASTTRTAAQTAVSGSAKDRFNRAQLHPMKTGNTDLDTRVEQILASVTTGGMTTYEKVKAIYDYILSHVEYGRNSLNQSDELNAYVTRQDAILVLSALDTLKEGVGVCDDYAALFMVMTRAVGLDCWYTTGYTTNTKGETKAHSWNTITVDGVEYLSDAQVEDKQSANGVRYTFFCQTYDADIVRRVYSGYDHAASKAAFGNFKRK